MSPVDRGDGGRIWPGPEGICSRSELLQLRSQDLVLVNEPAGGLGVGRRDLRALAAARPRTQGVEDDGDVDCLLEERTDRGRKETQPSEQHRGQGHPDPGQDTLPGDQTSPPGDRHGLGQAVQAVDRQHDVGRLRRGCDASGPHRDADVGAGQRRRVVDAVADHDRRTANPFRDHRVDLVGRAAIAERGVDAEHTADAFGDVGAIAGHHHHPSDSATAQITDRARCVGADRVVEQDARPSVRRRSPRRR